MIHAINSTNSNYNKGAYQSFQNANNLKNGYIARRYHTSEDVDFKTKVKAASGGIIGTLLPIMYFTKKQTGKTPNLKRMINMKYGLKEMCITSLSGILGGALFGMAGESEKKKIRKRKEAIFQTMNSMMPLLGVAGFLKLSDIIPELNNKPARVTGTALGLTIGMYTGAKLSNKINDPKDLEPDRRVNMQDAIANIDDILSGLVLVKFPLIDKLPVEKILPLIFAWCGYRAGQSN